MAIAYPGIGFEDHECLLVDPSCGYHVDIIGLLCAKRDLGFR